jgi:hypothetical protein
MNVEGKGRRAAKQKVYTVDTRKPRANAELSVFLNATNEFQEILPSVAPRRAPIYRYFRFMRDPIHGVPKAQLEAAFQAAAATEFAAAFQASAPVAPVHAAEVLPPAPANSQGSYGAMHKDEGIDDLAAVLAEQGVASQGEFDELAALMEHKAQIGGARRRRQSRRQRKSRRRSRRSRR